VTIPNYFAARQLMNQIVFGIFTIFFCHISDSIDALESEPKISLNYPHGKSAQLILPAHSAVKLANLEREIEGDSHDAIAYHNRAIAQVKSGNYHQAITNYTQAIESIDRSNVRADEPTLAVNNARKAGIYNDRGLVKLKLGDKRGAIDDLTLAAELFDEVGLSDISARSMQIVKILDP
jgi:tetratricopeptide (TPR) repeat protein